MEVSHELTISLTSGGSGEKSSHFAELAIIFQSYHVETAVAGEWISSIKKIKKSLHVTVFCDFLSQVFSKIDYACGKGCDRQRRTTWDEENGDRVDILLRRSSLILQL